MNTPNNSFYEAVRARCERRNAPVAVAPKPELEPVAAPAAVVEPEPVAPVAPTVTTNETTQPTVAPPQDPVPAAGTLGAKSKEQRNPQFRVRLPQRYIDKWSEVPGCKRPGAARLLFDAADEHISPRELSELRRDLRFSLDLLNRQGVDETTKDVCRVLARLVRD